MGSAEADFRRATQASCWRMSPGFKSSRCCVGERYVSHKRLTENLSPHRVEHDAGLSEPAAGEVGPHCVARSTSAGHLMRNASFLSFPAFISSRIQRGVAPRPAHVSFGSLRLRYFAGTFRPLSAEPRGRP